MYKILSTFGAVRVLQGGFYLAKHTLTVGIPQAQQY
jgi:hypothetical protein